MDVEQLLLEHLDSLEALSRSLAQRRGLRGAELDDFHAWARLKLLEDDYDRLRRFRARSSFETFLYTVLSNLLQDYLHASWGKWRPSVVSRRMGPVAVRLDRLLNQKGLSVTEAVRIVQETEADAPSERELREMCARVPERPARSFVGAAHLKNNPGSDPPDERLLAQERGQRLEAALQSLEEALRALPLEDRVLVRMHHLEGLTVAEVARALGLDQKPLYRRLEQIRARLREEMESRGVSSDSVAELLEGPPESSGRVRGRARS